MSFPLQLSVLDLQATSRTEWKNFQSPKGYPPKTVTIVIQRLRPQTIPGLGPIFNRLLEYMAYIQEVCTI